MNKRFTQGFTLIELAIVLLIIAVILGSFVGTLSTGIENKRVSDTEKNLDEIKQALIGFAYVNGYLPCPDCIAAGCSDGVVNFSRDGIEDRGTGVAVAGSCSVGNGVGTLPWDTLGLGRGDAWNTRYRYWVQNEYARDNTNNDVFSLSIPSPLPGEVGSGSGVILEPDYVLDPTGGAVKNLARYVVAVVFSHGKNTFGGISVSNQVKTGVPVANASELVNANVGGVFVDRPSTSVGATIASGEFDDILIWISEFELKAKMVEAGALPN